MSTYEFPGTTTDFPTATFDVPGDVASVRYSGQAYGRFATLASEAATGIRTLDSSGWVGDEGELFRSQAGELPPKLDVAFQAFTLAAGALSSFAGSLEIAKSQMATERSEAELAWVRLKSARAQVQTQIASRPTFTTPGDEATWNAQTHDLQVGADSAEAEWQRHLSRAQSIRQQADTAAAGSATAIRSAAELSPTAHQNWFEDKLDKAGNWVDSHIDIRRWLAEHAEGLRQVGGWLKVGGWVVMGAGAVIAGISAVAGFFSLGVGWLGEVPAGLMIGIGGAMIAGGDVLEGAADWGQGRISGREFVFDLGLNVALTAATFGIGKAVEKLAAKFAPALAERLPAGFTSWFARLRSGAPAAAAAAGANVVLKAGGNEARYEIQNGVVTKVTATLRQDFGTVTRDAAERSAQAGVRANGLSTDHAGHMVAHRYLPNQGITNLFPQDANLNLSAWKTMENEWGDWINNGLEVKPTIEFYPPGQVRPDSMKVSYEIINQNGDLVYEVDGKVFNNSAGERFDRVLKNQMNDLIQAAK